MIRILFFVFLEILSAQETIHPSASFFAPSIEANSEMIGNCSPIFVDMVKSSNYDFGRWMPDVNPQEVKNLVSLWWDRWNDLEISVKLFFDGSGDSGNGMLTWMRYDFKKKILLDLFPDETPMQYNKEIEKKFLSCIKRFKEE